MYFLVSLTLPLALLISFFQCVISDCGQVIKIDQEKIPESHALIPELERCSTEGDVHCRLTYRTKYSFVRSITQLCTRNSFLLLCDIFHSASFVVSSSQDSLQINCETNRYGQFCAPRGEDMEVTYTGSPQFFCSDMNRKITQFLGVHQRQVYKNVVKLSSEKPCYNNGLSRALNGTMISTIHPRYSKNKYLCNADITVPYSAKQFCMKFVRFDTDVARTSLQVKFRFWRNSVKLTTSDVAAGDTRCLKIREGGRDVLINVKPGNKLESGRRHTFIIEYYSLFESDDDEDDDDSDYDDLYWLFVIPGVFIMGRCCYHCCKDKGEDDAEDAASSQSDGSGSDEARTPLQELGIPDQQSRDAGDDFTELTHAPPMPSAPPMEYSQPQIRPAVEPPSYFTLFPDQKL